MRPRPTFPGFAKGKTPLVKLVALESAKPARIPGSLPGLIVHMADDVDAPLVAMVAGG